MGNQSSYRNYDEYEEDDKDGEIIMHSIDEDNRENRLWALMLISSFGLLCIYHSSERLKHIRCIPLFPVTIIYQHFFTRKYLFKEYATTHGFYKRKIKKQDKLQIYVVQKALFNHNNELLDKKKILHNIFEFINEN